MGCGLVKMTEFAISKLTQLSVLPPPFIRRYRGSSFIKMRQVSSWHVRAMGALYPLPPEFAWVATALWLVKKGAHRFFSSCSFCYLEQDLWQIFWDSCESEKHILTIDPWNWALFFFFKDDLEGTIVIYKGDLKCNFFYFEVGWATSLEHLRVPSGLGSFLEIHPPPII